ncbi:MAG: hypothetical protein P1V97_20460 [Planctomycetota bacterium]|nr:hypothetical protein [Planctomycetota bacterium]
MAELTGKIKPTVKKMEGMSSQILSLGRVSMEAADKLKKLVKDSQSTPVAEAPKLDPKLIEDFADKIAEGIQKLELKVNAIGRGISKVDKDISRLPQQIDDQGDNFEVNFAAIESKVSGLLERADMGGVLDKLEPRLRNSEDGLKVLLNKIRDVTDAVTENHTLLKADKSEETLEILESILDRQSAIETLSMVLTPLSQSYQDMSNSLKESSQSSLPEEFSEQFEELCERVDRNEELLEKILDRQGAIESLSMVLHPLSQSFQTLSTKLEETASVDSKIDALSRQMTALQAMVRNTYRKADKALASQPSAALSKDDLQTMAGFEKPGPVEALEESEDMPWYVPKDAKRKKKKAPEASAHDGSGTSSNSDAEAEKIAEASSDTKSAALESTEDQSSGEDGPVDLDSMDLGLIAGKGEESVPEDLANPSGNAGDTELASDPSSESEVVAPAQDEPKANEDVDGGEDSKSEDVQQTVDSKAPSEETDSAAGESELTEKSEGESADDSQSEKLSEASDSESSTPSSSA